MIATATGGGPVEQPYLFDEPQHQARPKKLKPAKPPLDTERLLFVCRRAFREMKGAHIHVQGVKRLESGAGGFTDDQLESGFRLLRLRQEARYLGGQCYAPTGRR